MPVVDQHLLYTCCPYIGEDADPPPLQVLDPWPVPLGSTPQHPMGLVPSYVVLRPSPGASASLLHNYFKSKMPGRVWVALEPSIWASLMQESSGNCSHHGCQAAVGGVGAL